MHRTEIRYDGMLVNSAILIPVLRWTVPVSTLNGSVEIFNRQTRHGEQARYSTLLSGPIVIVFRNCAKLFISSSLLPENILLLLLFRLRFYRRYFFRRCVCEFPTSDKLLSGRCICCIGRYSRAKFLPCFFLCFWKRVFLLFVPDCSDLLLPLHFGTILFYLKHKV